MDDLLKLKAMYDYYKDKHAWYQKQIENKMFLTSEEISQYITERDQLQLKIDNLTPLLENVLNGFYNEVKRETPDEFILNKIADIKSTYIKINIEYNNEGKDYFIGISPENTLNEIINGVGMYIDREFIKLFPSYSLSFIPIDELEKINE